MPWHSWNGWGHMGFMWLFWVALIAVIVWLLIRAAPGPTSSGEVQDSPEQILKRRYARGEIEKEEYERRLTDLRR
jgi:putative membrane protein